MSLVLHLEVLRGLGDFVRPMACDGHDDTARDRSDPCPRAIHIGLRTRAVIYDVLGARTTRDVLEADNINQLPLVTLRTKHTPP